MNLFEWVSRLVRSLFLFHSSHEQLVLSLALPDKDAVVHRHLEVFREVHAMGFSQSIEVGEIADAAVGVTLLEPIVEAAIAVAGVFAVVVEGAVEGEDAGRFENLADTFEEVLHGLPAHDVGGIGAEDGVAGLLGPGAEDIEVDGWTGVGQSGLVEPGADAGVVLRPFAGLPGEMGHGGGEVNRMLAGAATDLQDMNGVAEEALQDCQDWGFVLVAGLGVGFLAHLINPTTQQGFKHAFDQGGGRSTNHGV
jgi:hypothetical protein